MKKLSLGMAALAASTMVAAPAQAAVEFLGTFGGNECSGKGGFTACYAGPDGVWKEFADGRSPSIFKLDNETAEIDISDLYPSITGLEFLISYIADTNTLSFTYTPGVDDPAIHYFSVKQANGYALFYDSDPILSGSVALDTYFPNNPGWSHITFFNSGWPDNGVPEPATWAMLLLGFGAIGATLRARKAGSGDRRLRVA